MQKLAGCITSLGRFISKMGERALPFFKLMKRKEPFEWTPEADAAFQDLKRYLTSPPVMVAPRPLKPFGALSGSNSALSKCYPGGAKEGAPGQEATTGCTASKQSATHPGEGI